MIDIVNKEFEASGEFAPTCRSGFRKTASSDLFHGALLKVVPAFVFLNLLFGDYCDYFSRVYNPLSFPIQGISPILVILKPVICALLVCCLLQSRESRSRISLPLILILAYAILLSTVHCLYPVRRLLGDYIEFGENINGVLGVGLFPSNSINYISRNLDLLILVISGAVSPNGSKILRRICLAALWTLPFHLLNALLQFVGFFVVGVEASAAVFFSTSSNYISIGQRLTGLFVNPFNFSIYLALIQYILYLLNIKYKHVLSIILLTFHVISLTRTGIILWIVVEFFCLRNFWKERDWRIITVVGCIGAASLLVISLAFDLQSSIFQRLIQPLNAEENFSFMSRTTVPFINLKELLFNEPFLFLFGVGNVTTIGTDSGLVASLYQEGAIYTVAFYGLLISISRHNPRLSYPILAAILISAFLFAGSNQTVTFIYYYILSIFFYNSYDESELKNINKHYSSDFRLV